MSLPKIIDVENLNDEKIKELIIETKKELFNLRQKKAKFETFQPHSFKHMRHRLAQLLTIQNQRHLKIQTSKN